MNNRRSAEPGPVEYVQQSWPADPEHAPEARAVLRRWLRSLHLGGDETEGILLAASEAVDNAVHHAYPTGQDGSFEVKLWIEPGMLHVDIADQGHWRDTEGGQTGRGIVLMRSLVKSVVINVGRSGTCVSLYQPIPTEIQTVESRASKSG
ncbi:MAG TPA: ATP-binding protein [Pseudonocardia sp.]|jgi:anti-sigma regulatory factor (Ser/Thr protein kinase)|nr:ATP-binding protein [Pseudonocardia sp.]